jgi:hypothetical protein
VQDRVEYVKVPVGRAVALCVGELPGWVKPAGDGWESGAGQVASPQLASGTMATGPEAWCSTP